jgi:hypothetical protein
VALGEIGDGRRGQNPCEEDVDSRARETGYDGCFEELTAGSRVATNDSRGSTVAAESTGLAEDVCRSSSEG